MDQKNDKTTCLACSCPCDMHKEHNHLIEKKREEAKTCSAYEPEHKQGGGKCDCGCK